MVKILGLEFGKKKEAEETRHGVGNDHQIETYPNNTNLSLGFGSLFNNQTAMNLSAVYRAVGMISDSVAMLPIEIKIKNGDYKNKIENHPLYQVLYDKNAKMNKFTFMKMLVQSIMLRGNGFAHIERNSDGSVKSLRYVEAGDVSIVYDKMKNTLWYLVPTITPKRIEPINMIHLVKNSYDGVNGISNITYANRSIKNANNTENSANNFFESGCNLAGVLTVDGQLTPQQRNDIKNNWNITYTNGGSGLAVLQGNMKYQPIQLNASDSQLIESRNFNITDIARFFEISPVLLGDLTHASYNTIEAIQQDFLLHTLQPYICLIEEEFTKKLLKPSEYNLMVNLREDYLLKTDKAATADYYSKLVNNGIISRNEARKELGYDEIEGGDKLVVPFTNIEDNTINKSDEDGNKE